MSDSEKLITDLSSIIEVPKKNDFDNRQCDRLWHFS